MNRTARRFAAALLAVTALSACSSAPTEDPSASASEAICGNGLQPGCGDVYRSSSSPTGCSQTCWTCGGAFTENVACPCGMEFAHCCSGGGCRSSGDQCMSLLGIGFPGVDESKCVPKNEQSELAILVASYGDNCGAPAGNATAALSAACDGRASCAYTVDYRVLGDPAPGCAKRFAVTYTCGTSGTHDAVLAPEAGFGSVLRLTCP